MIVYLTGPATTPADINRMAAAASDLAESQPWEMLVTWPNGETVPWERLRAVCDAEQVFLHTGWEFDVLARRDAQVAVWGAKEIKGYDPLRRTISSLEGKSPGKAGPALEPFTHEVVQDILDRGLQLPAFPSDGMAR